MFSQPSLRILEFAGPSSSPDQLFPGLRELKSMWFSHSTICGSAGILEHNCQCSEAPQQTLSSKVRISPKWAGSRVLKHAWICGSLGATSSRLRGSTAGSEQRFHVCHSFAAISNFHIAMWLWKSRAGGPIALTLALYPSSSLSLSLSLSPTL